MSRLKYNIKCLTLIETLMESHPDLRFTQALELFDLAKDRYYEEPNETYEQMKERIKVINVKPSTII